MEKILGNFLTQANRDFPLDCETLEYLQGLSALGALAGNVGGDRIVLWGCEPNTDGTRRGAGYVFVRTRGCPEGEVLPWAGGPTTSGMYVRQEAVGVNANNTDYPMAYTRRSLAPGIGEENYSWESFTDLKSVKELMAEAAGLRAAIAGVQPTPAGTVVLWGGKAAPAGWLVCDGRDYAAAEYAELHGVVGEMYNEGANASGGKWSDPGAGRFRVPDLRGRFVVGLNSEDEDYNELGASGGSKRVALSVEELPEHSHRHDARGASSAGARNGSGAGNGVEGLEKWVTEATGGGASHENRPPYYAMVYIIKAK